MPANRCELLATWYLRFNGYFTTPDFTIHPSFKKQAGGTDADVLAVRFAESEEYQARFHFDRDAALIKQDRTDFLICEVKAGRCEINPKTWRDPSRENVEYAIRWMGFASSNEAIRACAKDVYATGQCDMPVERRLVRFVSFGGYGNDDLRKQMPLVQQILHSHVIGYLRGRFMTGCHNATRENWDADIADFARLCTCTSDECLLEWARQ